MGIIHGLVLWFVAIYALEVAVINSSGHVSDYWFMSVSLFTSVVLVSILFYFEVIGYILSILIVYETRKSQILIINRSLP